MCWTCETALLVPICQGTWPREHSRKAEQSSLSAGSGRRWSTRYLQEAPVHRGPGFELPHYVARGRRTGDSQLDSHSNWSEDSRWQSLGQHG